MISFGSAGRTTMSSGDGELVTMVIKQMGPPVPTFVFASMALIPLIEILRTRRSLCLPYGGGGLGVG